jgi:hypothetical protein
VKSPPRLESLRYLGEATRHPLLVFWALFLFATPFYVFASGLPQPGDLLVLVLVPTAVVGWNGRLPAHLTRTLRPLLYFVAWVTAVNWTWALVLGKFEPSLDYTLFPMFYVFNAAVVVVALIAYARHGNLFLKVTAHVVLASVVFQIASSFFYRTDLFRGQLFFNNPNQLGYYSLLAACLLALLQRRIGMQLLTASIGLTGCGYLALLSGSRAALIGIALLTLFLVLSNIRLVLITGVATIGLLSMGGPISDAIDNTQARALEDRDPETSFVVERGYDRLWDFPEYAILGAGEGDIGRFTDNPKRSHEIHSSAVTVLFSYGIPGAVLILVFIARVIRGAPRRAALMLLPILTYTIAHQGLRFTMLWVLIVVFITHKTSPPVANRPKKSATSRTDVESALATTSA